MNQSYIRGSVQGVESNNFGWSALDPASEHPLSRYFKEDGQNAVQQVKDIQINEELIFINNSLDVDVHTTDTKIALSLVAALNAAISLVLNLSVASNCNVEEIKQNLYQSAGIRQVSVQKTIIENSRNVKVETTDTQVAINIQLLLLILLSLLINLDIL